MSELRRAGLDQEAVMQEARNKTVEAVTREHGYIKEGDKEKLHNRLRRIEGQVRGIQRMVEEEAYCVDILTQIGSVVSASEKVATIMLRDHVEHCVRESIEKGESADEKIEDLPPPSSGSCEFRAVCKEDEPLCKPRLQVSERSFS